MVIHGDAFTALGHEESLNWYRKGIEGQMSTKVKGRLGPGDKDMKVMRVLNRIVEWKENGITYEADQRHGEIICREMELKETARAPPHLAQRKR